jgi:D-serine deaminase-like pyridoxal phosphate-dependent protein
MLNVEVPSLILDKSKCLKNIQRMVDKAENSKVKFRPHFKTHQSAEIGNWFRSFNVSAITVSSVSMAHYFANHGWSDITIAFPVNIREIKSINQLAGKITLNILLVNSDIIHEINLKLNHKVGVFLKIDTGYHRTGIPAENEKEITQILGLIKKSTKLEFKGFLTHTGHTYKANSTGEIKALYTDTVEKLTSLKNTFSSEFEKIILSIGDTPSCSIVNEFEKIDEVRPGNFVFYDLMQYYLGSCSSDQIAVAMACPVVAKHKQDNKLIIYGGAIHFSKEYIIDKENRISYGQLIGFTKKGWEFFNGNNYLVSLSQEHGIVKVTDQIFVRYKTGDVLGIIPVHSCLTANLMKGYITLDGKRVDHMAG